jgi:hypothetical protein
VDPDILPDFIADMPLEEQFYESATARWKRELPWLKVFRSFRMALDFRKLMLAFIGVTLFAAGYAAMHSLPFAPDSGEHPFDTLTPAARWGETIFVPASAAAERRVPLQNALKDPWSLIPQVFHYTPILLMPWNDVVDPAASILDPRFNRTWADTAWAWTVLLWTLIVWSVFGVAISRIAVREFTGVGSPGLNDGFRHALRFFPSSLGGPLLPVVAVGFFWAIAACIGLIGRVPGAGPVLVWVFWPLAMICGALLGLILIGVAATWPLMFCTISVEGTDAFDAMSRAYSYLFSRPWYALFLGVLALIYGSAVTLFLFSAAGFAAELAAGAVNSGMGTSAIGPILDSSRDATLEMWDLQWLMRATISVLGVLLTAYIYSFFWTTLTAGYLLLRHAVDATPLDHLSGDVQLEGPALAGIAASERREAQRNESPPDEPPGGIAPTSEPPAS